MASNDERYPQLRLTPNWEGTPPSDDLPMAEWQRTRNAQVQGASNRSGQVRPDPRRTEVFKTGPDGKLHPVEGWTTTGPFEVDRWRKNIDWGGVADDLSSIAIDSAGAMTLGFKSVFDLVNAASIGKSLYDRVEEAKRTEAKRARQQARPGSLR